MWNRVSRQLLATVVLVSFSFSACTAQRSDPNDSSATTVADVPARHASVPGDDITASRQNAITRAVKVVAPAVVGINVTEVREYSYRDPMSDMFSDPFFEHYFGRRRSPQTFQQEVRGLGSGFLISSDGFIVTNDHVAGSATKIIVTTSGGKQYDARIVGTDATSDIALLKIDAKDLPYLSLGNSDDVMVGEWAIALGNPFGLFDINANPTVTVGVISNTGVNLQPTDRRVYRGMLQTDAAISSGNSGGPLVNTLGQVIGVNATIYSTSNSRMGAGSIGIGFAIPINRARSVIEDLKKNGSIDRRYWTGMSIRQVDERIARYLKLASTDGVVVVEVVPGSPAEKAGLAQGDVITSINGNAVRTEDNALLLLYDGRVGDRLELVYMRDGTSKKGTLQLERQPTE